MNISPIIHALPTIVVFSIACIWVHILKERYENAKFRRRMLEQESFREEKRKEAKTHLEQTIERIRLAKLHPAINSSASQEKREKVVAAGLSGIQYLLIESGESFHWNDASQATSSCLEEELMLIAQVEDVDD